MKALRRWGGLTFAVTILAVVMMFGAGQGCQPPANAATPAGTGQPGPGGTLNMGQMTQWFESQGDSPNASAGIVGNSMQENGLSPALNSGGLGLWQITAGSGQLPAMYAYAAAHHLNPESDAAQMGFLQQELTGPYKDLLAKMNASSSPEDAATMFETVYEVCSGVTGYMQVTPGSLCNDSARRQYARQAYNAAGGPGMPASATGSTAGTGVATGCAAAAIITGQGRDPLPGFTQSRDDAGVDACAQPGMPIVAPVASTLVQIIGDWYAGQPLMLFKFDQQQAGTPAGVQYWFVAEQITPVSSAAGTDFPAGAVVAHYAAGGTCTESGWGSPTSNSRTFAEQQGDPGAMSPGAGSTTVWAESWKKWAGLPASWLGRSP